MTDGEGDVKAENALDEGEEGQKKGDGPSDDIIKSRKRIINMISAKQIWIVR